MAALDSASKPDKVRARSGLMAALHSLGRHCCLLACWLSALSAGPGLAEAPADSVIGTVPSSPAAVQETPGTGALGRALGLSEDSGWRLGGAWTGNSTRQLQGGIQGPTQLGFSQQLLLDLSVDLERWADWDGGKLWVQLLQVNLNQEAYLSSGSLQGSNSLVTPEPWDRTQLYSYAYSQYLLDQQVRILLGKLAPSVGFANVVTPVAVAKNSPYQIPAVTALTFTPPYALPTLLGRLPGYPNSALGASLLVQPDAFKKDLYLRVGVFDGRGGLGVDEQVETGLAIPSLSKQLFSIAELGGAWTAGTMNKPGAAALGIWRQAGPLKRCNEEQSECLRENSASGGYLVAQQRLLNFRHPKDDSGISSFVQLQWSPSTTNLFRSAIGAGFTMFAPMPSRLLDSYGVGLAWGRVNNHGFRRELFHDSELMLQAYGQLHLRGSVYITPSITVLPSTGLRSASAPSTAAMLQLSALF